MAIQIIDPRFMTAVEWTDFMTLPLDPFGDTMSINDESEWKEWANVVNQMPAIARTNPPDPRTFDDWREWAMRFNQAINLASQ